MPDPTRIVVAGDWHGNSAFAAGVIEQLPELIPGERYPLLLHLGDFGIWPGPPGDTFLRDVTVALHRVGARLWFVDGNHEDHSYLTGLLRRRGHDRAHRIPINDRIQWLPRGHRWSWHGRRWLALGGATSVDRLFRVPGRSWWPGEALTAADLVAATAPGHADVMVCHDCPAGVELNLPRPAPSWMELGPAEAHREMLGAVVASVEPSWLLHGHFHLVHDTVAAFAHGPLHVTGLADDSAFAGNFRVLDIQSMAWVSEMKADGRSE